MREHCTRPSKRAGSGTRRNCRCALAQCLLERTCTSKPSNQPRECIRGGNDCALVLAITDVSHCVHECWILGREDTSGERGVQRQTLMQRQSSSVLGRRHANMTCKASQSGIDVIESSKRQAKVWSGMLAHQSLHCCVERSARQVKISSTVPTIWRCVRRALRASERYSE